MVLGKGICVEGYAGRTEILYLCGWFGAFDFPCPRGCVLGNVEAKAWPSVQRVARFLFFFTYERMGTSNACIGAVLVELENYKIVINEWIQVDFKCVESIFEK